MFCQGREKRTIFHPQGGGTNFDTPNKATETCNLQQIINEMIQVFPPIIKESLTYNSRGFFVVGIFTTFF